MPRSYRGCACKQAVQGQTRQLRDEKRTFRVCAPSRARPRPAIMPRACRNTAAAETSRSRVCRDARLRQHGPSTVQRAPASKWKQRCVFTACVSYNMAWHVGPASTDACESLLCWWCVCAVNARPLSARLSTTGLLPASATASHQQRPHTGVGVLPSCPSRLRVTAARTRHCNVYASLQRLQLESYRATVAAQWP